MKRVFDVLLGAALLVLAVPLLLPASIVLAATLGANPFFLQRRVGLGARQFTLFKLRTLPTSTPTDLDKHGVAALDVPRVCRLVRRLHLDELPQLINVIVGSMSLVGPRPEMPNLHQRMDPGFATLRTSITPGCTGLWQISTSCQGLIDEDESFDRFYVTHRNLRLDAWVLTHTLRCFVGRPRMITIGEVRGRSGNGRLGVDASEAGVAAAE